MTARYQHNRPFLSLSLIAFNHVNSPGSMCLVRLILGVSEGGREQGKAGVIMLG